MKKINIGVWTNGVNWTILDDWQYKVYEGGDSFEKSSHFLGSDKNLMKKMNVLVGTNGVNWIILDDWQYIVYEESKGHIV